MFDYLFRPKAPLLFRQGRPFNAGHVATTAPFPRPDTVAGALRTAMADVWEPPAARTERHTRGEILRRIRIVGPLLVRRSLDGGSAQLLFPAPADAWRVQPESGGRPKIVRLQPMHRADATGTDLPPEIDTLMPCRDLDGPSSSDQRFWTWNTFITWQAEPATEELLESIPQTREFQTDFGPALDTRVHVQVDTERESAVDGMLFQTQGMDYGPSCPVAMRPGKRHSDGKNVNSSIHEYALLVRCEQRIASGMRRLGGRSRLAFLDEQTGLWPACPAHLATRLQQASHLRITLVTPAVFAGGWHPDWLTLNSATCRYEGEPPHVPGLRLQLRGVAMKGWEPKSGWDAGSNRPKPLYRMVPAGAVYWFEILKRNRLAEPALLWLQSICTGQNELDGFGLVVPGVWKLPT